ncbi:MAG: YHYH protein [Myxococcales bacterium]|nr:YHYH protein [Myxococcales bacterium]
MPAGEEATFLQVSLAGAVGCLVLGACLPMVACQTSDGAGSDSGTSGSIDITGATFTRRSADCADYAQSYSSAVVDVQRRLGFEGFVEIVASDDSCTLTSNAIPNHDFDQQGASFATPTAALETTFVIKRHPGVASSPTALELRSYDAVMLNGVVVDLLAAGCFGVGDGKIGCNDLSSAWRYDPMSPSANFGTDVHNAHTQPDGRYHYHGDPLAMYGESSEVSPVIGFAADGFPIYGPYFDDGGTIREARSGFSLKIGSRPSGASDPGGDYDGTFVDDYEYTGAGDLDECNGMTIDGQYGYYVTRTYPWVLACLKGAPDASFDKRP